VPVRTRLHRLGHNFDGTDHRDRRFAALVCGKLLDTPEIRKADLAAFRTLDIEHELVVLFVLPRGLPCRAVPTLGDRLADGQVDRTEHRMSRVFSDKAALTEPLPRLVRAELETCFLGDLLAMLLEVRELTVGRVPELREADVLVDILAVACAVPLTQPFGIL